MSTLQKIQWITSLILFTIIIYSITYYLNKDKLLGKWESKKGEYYGLIEKNGAPFIIEFKEKVFIFQNESYKIKEIIIKENKQIIIKTEKLQLKLKFIEKNKIVFNFPKVGIRIYKKMN